jgi:hypothetical protein
MHVRGGRITWVACIQNDDSATSSSQNQRGAEAGRATADDCHIVFVRCHVMSPREPDVNALPSVGIPALDKLTPVIPVAQAAAPSSFAAILAGWDTTPDWRNPYTVR